MQKLDLLFLQFEQKLGDPILVHPHISCQPSLGQGVWQGARSHRAPRT
jgi:hypothetical protein